MSLLGAGSASIGCNHVPDLLHSGALGLGEAAMHKLGPACAAAIVALALAVGPVHAQSTALPAAPSFEKEPFSGSDLLHGKKITQAECEALPSAVWVVAEGQQECIRYFHSAAGGGRSEVIIRLSQDLVSTNGRGDVKPYDYYIKATPAQVQDLSAAWSRNLGLPYLHLSRPGTYGSSGEHSKRRTAGEIAVISAALDAIKARHGYSRFHLIGWSTGGHSAAALMARRTDLGCVVLSSALLSVRSYLAEFGRSEDWTGNKNPIDPIALVDQITARPDLRIFVLTDPDDTVISARSQTAYVKRLAAAKLPVRQIFVAAPDTSAHQLDNQARQVLAACAKGMADDAIVAKFQNKLPETPPDADDPPLHPPNLLTRSVTVTESQCKSLRTAAWVRVDGTGYCVRYWISTAGGSKDEAIVFVHGDLGDPKNPNALNQYSALITAGRLQRDAHRLSRTYGGPFIAVGRLGAYGSSGDHRKRRSLLEIRVVMAALDELRTRYGFKRFHLAGQSGGGNTVAGLVQMRDDIGCAVMAAGSISVKSNMRDKGIKNAARFSGYDPIDFVGKMQDKAGRRLIVMSDPDDQIVLFRSQREFVERVRAKGIPVLQINADSGAKNFHGLHNESQRLVADCAKGTDDDALVTRYQTKPAPQRAEGEARAPAAIGSRSR
jgi:pimeloyl-ACP methyl ester carboxylesterase